MNGMEWLERLAVPVAGLLLLPTLIIACWDEWNEFWRHRCHACWVDAQRSWKSGTLKGAVTSVLTQHTCWRNWRLVRGRL